MRDPEELRALVEDYLDRLAFHEQLGALEEAAGYALEGGKRVRGTICLATAEAAGAEAEAALPAATALELVHAFSLVHDDLPALDDDAERRGRPSTWSRHGEAVAILAGDALLVEGLRLAASYPGPEIARELAGATLAMIGGQYLDVTGTAPDEAALHRLKTGALLAASVALPLWIAGVPAGEQQPWRAFGAELGLVFQLVDDILDGDGVARSEGPRRARELADAAARRAQQRLAAVEADTTVLGEIVHGLAARTA